MDTYKDSVELTRLLRRGRPAVAGRQNWSGRAFRVAMNVGYTSRSHRRPRRRARAGGAARRRPARRDPAASRRGRLPARRPRRRRPVLRPQRVPHHVAPGRRARRHRAAPLRRLLRATGVPPAAGAVRVPRRARRVQPRHRRPRPHRGGGGPGGRVLRVELGPVVRHGVPAGAAAHVDARGRGAVLPGVAGGAAPARDTRPEPTGHRHDVGRRHRRVGVDPGLDLGVRRWLARRVHAHRRPRRRPPDGRAGGLPVAVARHPRLRDALARMARARRHRRERPRLGQRQPRHVLRRVHAHRLRLRGAHRRRRAGTVAGAPALRDPLPPRLRPRVVRPVPLARVRARCRPRPVRHLVSAGASGRGSRPQHRRHAALLAVRRAALPPPQGTVGAWQAGLGGRRWRSGGVAPPDRPPPRPHEQDPDEQTAAPLRPSPAAHGAARGRGAPAFAACRHASPPVPASSGCGRSCTPATATPARRRRSRSTTCCARRTGRRSSGTTTSASPPSRRSSSSGARSTSTATRCATTSSPPGRAAAPAAGSVDPRHRLRRRARGRPHRSTSTADYVGLDLPGHHIKLRGREVRAIATDEARDASSSAATASSCRSPTGASTSS